MEALLRPSVTSVCYGNCISLTHLTYLPAQHQNLAEAVPEVEEDYPCISCGSVIRNQSFRACMRCEHGGSEI